MTIHACMYIRKHECICVCMSNNVYAYIHVCLLGCKYIYIHVRTHVSMPMSTSMPMSVSVSMSMAIWLCLCLQYVCLYAYVSALNLKKLRSHCCIHSPHHGRKFLQRHLSFECRHGGLQSH